MNKRVFVFDWDGTIFDSMEQKYSNFAKILQKKIEEHHNVTIDVQLLKLCYVELSGIPRKEIVNKICGRVEVEFSEHFYDDFSFALSEQNKIDLLDMELFEDAVVFMELLKQKGKILYISSSVPGYELSYLAQEKLPVKLHQYISGIYGTDGSFKKGKGHFDKIINDEYVEKKELIFFGDDIADVNLGIAYGVDTILVDRRNRNIDYDNVVQRLDENSERF